MKCDACAASVVAALRRVVGASDAVVSYASKTAVIAADAPVDTQDLVRAVESAGPYRVRGLGA
jgi:Cu+-exporting ATPase